METSENILYNIGKYKKICKYSFESRKEKKKSHMHEKHYNDLVLLGCWHSNIIITVVIIIHRTDNTSTNNNNTHIFHKIYI